MKQLKRIFAVLLALAVALSFVPSSVVNTQAATKGYTISKKSGTVEKGTKVKLKAKKGYKVYWVKGAKAKFSAKKVIKAGKTKSFTINKKTVIRVYAVKAGKKVTAKALKKAKGKKFTFKVKSNNDSDDSDDDDSDDGSVTIVGYTFGDKYVATAAADSYDEGATDSGNDWKNSSSASSNIYSVTLSNGEVEEADNPGDVLTLVIGGVQYDILDYYENKTPLGTDYEFASTAGSETYTEFAKFMNMGGNDAQYTFRQALKVDDGEVDDDETIESLVEKAGVTYDGASLNDATIVSMGAFFNGVYVKNTASYTINNLTMVMHGDGANDFEGEAAGVLAKGTSNVTLKDSVISTAGVIRTATAVSDNSVLNIEDSVIFSEEGDDTDEEYLALVVPMMKRTPFALGLEGTVRTTNVLGAGQGIYKNSLFASTGWGVLSTDSGQSGTHALDISDVVAGIGDVTVLAAGETESSYDAVKKVGDTTYGFKYRNDYSGYVAYADAGVIDTFDNVTFYAADYDQIMAAGTSTATYTNSTLNSGRIGVMTQQNAGGTITVKDSVMNVGDCGVQIKSGAANDGYTNVVLDNTTVTYTNDNIYSGVLAELVESDDAGNPGVITFTVDDRGDEAEVTDETVADSNVTLKNGSYEGGIYNNIYNKRQTLNVSIENANVDGTISASYGYHVDASGNRLANGTVLHAYGYADYRNGSSDFKSIGSQVNVPSEIVNNLINLTIDKDSTWTVGQINYLQNLTVASTDSFKGTGTVYADTLTVGGEAVADGEYEYGDVKVIVKAAD